MTAAKKVYEKYNKDYQNGSKISGLNDGAEGGAPEEEKDFG